MRQFLPHHPSQQFLQRRLMGEDILTQDLVDHGLVVSAALVGCLLAEPIEDVLVKADGDALLAGQFL